jgi:RNA polymerase sigma-70 factor, ECF subfamily
MQAIMECIQEESELENFEEIVRIHWKRIYRFILASVRSADVAQSLTQDCFVRSYNSRGSFRGQASVKTWLMKIAVNLVRDFGRNRRLQFWKRLSLSSISPGEVSDCLQTAAISPEEQALLNEQVNIVWRASRRLPEKQRTVFLLRFVEDMDILDIADATGMKEGTVKIHLFRAIHAIRERLGRSK